MQQLADRALSLVDAVHQFLKLFADGVELREDVVGTLKDGGEARLIGARNLAAGRDRRVIARAGCNVKHTVAQEALLRQHDFRVVADAVFHLIGIHAHGDDDGLVVRRRRHRAEIDVFDLADELARQAYLVAGLQAFGGAEARRVCHPPLEQRDVAGDAQNEDDQNDNRADSQQADAQFRNGRPLSRHNDSVRGWGSGVGSQ